MTAVSVVPDTIVACRLRDGYVGWTDSHFSTLYAKFTLEEAEQALEMFGPWSKALDKGEPSERCCPLHDGLAPAYSGYGFRVEVLSEKHELILYGPGIIDPFELTVPKLKHLLAHTEGMIDELRGSND